MQKLLREALRGRGERHVGQCAQIHRARRNGEARFQLADDTGGELLCHKFMSDGGDADADAREIDKQTVCAGLQLGLDRRAELEKVFLQIHARGCLAVEQDQRERCDLGGGIDMRKIAGVVRGGDKARVRFDAGNVE